MDIENKKIIILSSIVIIIIIIMLFGIINNKNNKNNKDNKTSYSNVNEINSIEIKDEINECFSKCFNEYRNNPSDNLENYYDESILNQYLNDGFITYIHNLDILRKEGIMLFDTNNEIIDYDFVNKYNFKLDSSTLEKNNVYLIKYTRSFDEKGYYYTVKYGANSKYYLDYIFYTIGEDIMVVNSEYIEEN